jgi:hypothetical protein
VTDRGGRWSGAPIRGVEPALDHADPTGGRHAFDQDAALTPIFTTLRRGAWRRSRRQPGPPPHRPQVDPAPGPRITARPHVVRAASGPGQSGPGHRDGASRFRDDPLTAPLPIVPPAYALGRTPADVPRPAGGYGPGSVDPYVPASFARQPEASVEATMWWRDTDDAHHPGADRIGDGRVADEWDADRYGYDPDGYDPDGYDPDGYDRVDFDRTADEHEWDRARAYDPTPHTRAFPDQQRYDRTFPDRLPYGPVPVDQGRYGPTFGDPGYHGVHGEPAYDEPVRYDSRRRHRRSLDPMSYDPVTDSGRHHRRLAPAGW